MAIETYPVKYLHSAMRGAPVLSGSAGALIAVLDACLTTGFGAVTLTALSVSSGVATATVSSGDSFDQHAIVQIAGASPGALNGTVRVLSRTATSFTFATDAADGAASGTITAKYAPLGNWQKAYSDTNLAAYQSDAAQANGHYLRVDDTDNMVSRVVGYTAMSGISSGLINPFPTDAQFSGGGYWRKSRAASSNAVRWRLIGDSRFFLLCIATASDGVASDALRPYFIGGFGDLAPLPGAPGDAWATALIVGGVDGNNHNGSLSWPKSASPNGMYTARVAAGVGSGVYRYFFALGTSGSTASGADNAFGSAPSTVDGAVLLTPLFVRESSTNTGALRAVVPGILHCPQTDLNAVVGDGEFLPAGGDLLGHVLLGVGVDAQSNPFSVPTGLSLIDITGPWR